MAITSALAALGKPVKQTNTTYRYPAPVKGLDTRLAVTKGDPLHCLFAYNLVPYDYGMRIRYGYREWAIGLDLGASVGVHTIVPFEGVLEDGTASRLFAVTNEAIWDVTVAGDPPILKFSFGDTTANAGHGT